MSKKTRDDDTHSTVTDGDTTQYENGLKPLVWLLVPFVLLLVYGYLS